MWKLAGLSQSRAPPDPHLPLGRPAGEPLRHILPCVSCLAGMHVHVVHVHGGCIAWPCSACGSCVQCTHGDAIVTTHGGMFARPCECTPAYICMWQYGYATLASAILSVLVISRAS